MLGRIAGALAGAFLSILAVSAKAQDYPKGPITLIAPFAPGSQTDTFARYFADALGKEFKQAVVVEAIAGANGMLGTLQALKRPADGLTVLIGTASTHAANYHLYNTVQYQPDNFEPVACLYRVLPVVTVRAGLPVKSMQELVAYSKANPGVVTYGWASSTTKVGAEILRARAEADVRPIFYRGSPQIITDMLGDRVDVYVDGPITTQPYVEAGQVRVLATTAASRIATLPDVPTLGELGYKNAVMEGWVAAFVRAGTPPEIINRLNAAFNSIGRSTDFKAFLDKARNEQFICSPQELKTFVQKEITTWGDLIGLAGIEKQ
jgi:tripartite-type tricarboxylate transporter receptor subunit TctC